MLGLLILMSVLEDLELGAGNAPLELILPVFEKSGYTTNISFEETIKEADKVMDYLIPTAPITTPINVLTGLTRLFSGFEKPIIKASKLYGVEYSSLIFELGNRKLVAGQEDLILEVAQKLKTQ
jgi:4-hydroxy 2-oxovalerate aldolase